MTRKQKRLLSIGVIGFVLLLAAGLVATALRDKIVFFHFPTDIVVHKKASPGQRVRIGGVVETGSVTRDGSNVVFSVTDGENTLPVEFVGILPDLFREGQGVIAEGMLKSDGRFDADKVLAKHDENYIPKELQELLKKKELWQGSETYQ